MWANDLYESVYSELDQAYKNGESFIRKEASAAKDAALKPVQWIWETLQGDFNEQLTISQIIGNAVLGIVPIVGQMLALRDLIANCKMIVRDVANVSAWVVLCLTLVAFFPALGAPVKGVFRILFFFLRKEGGNLGRALEPAIKPMVGFLCDPKVRRILRISEVDVALKNIAGKIREAKNLINVSTLTKQLSEALTTLESIVSKIRRLAPAPVAYWLDESVKVVRVVHQHADRMIAQALAPLQNSMEQFAVRIEQESLAHAAVNSAESSVRNVHTLPQGVSTTNPRILSNAKKGLFGEIVSDDYMVSKGHTNLLPQDRIKRSLEDTPTGRGIDGVYQNANPPPPYIITETKYRTNVERHMSEDGNASTKLLSQTKGSAGYPAAKQLSDDWISPRLPDTVSKDVIEKMDIGGYDRWLILVNQNGQVIQITRMDGAGKAIGTIAP